MADMGTSFAPLHPDHGGLYMSTAKNLRSVYAEQIAHIWQSFGPDQQAWAMLKMSDSLRDTLHRITAVAAPKKSVTEMLQELKTPTPGVASAYGSIMDQIRGNPELRLVKFLQSLQEEQQ